jgi:phenylpyruvate tautomerase PptA (4-oxalocrotonate tautomerase family)
MPLIKLETSASMTDAVKSELLKGLSEITASAIGKPEAYVMVTVSESAMCMAKEAGEAAFADIRSIGGLNQGVNREITKQVCALLKDKLDIPPSRVYLSFNDVAAVNWGWNNSTFG